MKIILIISIILISSNCSFLSDYQIEELYGLNIYIPKDFIDKKMIYTEHGKIFIFSYKDSIIYYFGQDIGMKLPNFQNIKKVWPENSNYKIERLIRKNLLLEGKDSNNLYWKECYINNFIIGYKNVPINLKLLFDKPIEKIKNDSKNQ